MGRVRDDRGTLFDVDRLERSSLAGTPAARVCGCLLELAARVRVKVCQDIAVAFCLCITSVFIIILQGQVGYIATGPRCPIILNENSN